MIKDLLSLHNVGRYTAHLNIRRQSVAEHSYRVAAITAYLCDKLELLQSIKAEAILWALYHDAAESRTGDIMTHTKQIIRSLYGTDSIERIENAMCTDFVFCLTQTKPSPHVVRIVKVADLLECYLWVRLYGGKVRCRVMGGNLAVQLNDRLRAAIADTGIKSMGDKVDALLKEINGYEI